MEKLLDRDAVSEAVHLSIPSIYRLMAKGLFPRPRKIGLRAVRWRETDIREFLESRPFTVSEVGQPPGCGLMRWCADTGSRLPK